MADHRDKSTNEAAGVEAAEASLLQEFVLFLREDRKWWFVPLIVMMLALGGIMAVAASPLGPWLYTLM